MLAWDSDGERPCLYLSNLIAVHERSDDEEAIPTEGSKTAAGRRRDVFTYGIARYPHAP